MTWTLYFTQMGGLMKSISMFVIVSFRIDRTLRDHIQEELMEADLHAIVKNLLEHPHIVADFFLRFVQDNL